MSQDRDYRGASSSPAAGPKGQAGPSVSSAGGQLLPSISLPKGGGAIKGMGEKFGVNAATGTGSMTVPLAASPGRSGFGPQLSLSYDSGAGNGPFGLGWSLSLPAITRKTDKGLPRYLDGDESDVFLISGAEDLVPILNSAGGRTSIPRTLHGTDYRVHLYQPRIEGLFARVERWTRVADGISHWRTITRDNVTTIFGLDENGRIFDPRDPRRIFSYLICRTFDDKGNATHYEYAVDDEAGIDVSTAHEANRKSADRRSQRYLKHIRYGNVQPYFPDWLPTGDETPFPANWHFQIVFDYGDHRADAPTPTHDLLLDPSWSVRPDPFSVNRAGFEVRTYRRCERVLLFHQFQGQPGFDEPTLVRSTDFLYSDEVTPTDARNPIYTCIESVTQVGYRRNDGGGYIQRSTPPLEFFYSQPEIHPEILTLTDGDSRENFPEGLDGSRFQWLDLDGEGIPGILHDQDGSWSYKRNFSPLNQVRTPGGERVTRARFGLLEVVPSLPVGARLGGSLQLLDLSGGGRPDLVTFEGDNAGYFERTTDGDWETLRTFKSLPNLNWSEPNLKFVDLTGDGRADVLIAEDDVYTFYASLGTDGFAQAQEIPTPWDEELGPRVVFADGTQTVSLADLSGDGLSDIVRARNGEVCYWPNLGYGRFGPKVTMDHAPRFDDEESFDARRIRFADVDGSGTTDILYIGTRGVEICFNRSGNSWAESRLLAIFPSADDLNAVQVTDLLGNGTACLVWSSPLPAESYTPLRYVDLMGSQKPHLMVRTRNNLGAETRLSYAPSTRFYLEDKVAGKPWITRLPFPVQVVERVEVYDWIGRSRFVKRYSYHHGYFDGAEREFRGFGMVEQRDTETHRDDTLFPDVDTSNEDAASFVPPMLTRTWFHTGAFVEAGTVSRQYAHEYWVEPALRGDTPATASAREATLLADTVLEGEFDPDEIREAYRALKGSTLRVEVYAEDGTARAEHPYTVTEQNFTVRRLQSRGPNMHAVFLPHSRESLSYHYERQPNDPRVTHETALEVDNFANVLRSVSVAYGRRPGYPEPEPNLSAAFRTMLALDQERLHIGATEHIFTFPVNQPTAGTLFDIYRAPLPCEKITAELTGIAPAGVRFSFEELDTHWTALWSGAHDIPYEDVSTPDIEGVGVPTAFARRIVERSRTLYRNDNLTALLPLRIAESQALPGETYRLALTPGLIARVFGPARVTDAILLEGGYVRLPGQNDWWIPSGRVFFSPGDGDTSALERAEARAHFYQIRRAVDPFGSVSRITYDDYDLLLSAAVDAVGNVTGAENDYYVLQQFRTTDPNGNFSEVSFDCLAQVVGIAVRGKAGEGDSLVGFEADLSDAAIQALRSGPPADSRANLHDATSRIVYDRFAYLRTRDLPTPEAPMVYTLTRETHVSDLLGGLPTSFHHVYLYSDGFGREVQRKVQAEVGPIPGVGDSVSRWVGSGWTIFNNKGKAVRKYEPFFTPTPQFEFNRRVGVSSIFFYDPTQRVVAALHPDNTFEKTVFDAWRQETWDANDNVLFSNPRTDVNVGPDFRRWFGDAPAAFVSWHDRRIDGSLGVGPEERNANRDAALKTAAHHATPAVAYFDSLRRTCLSIADNGVEGVVLQRLATRTALDAENNPLAVFDARGRHVMEFCRREPLGGGTGFSYVAGYDIAGSQLYHNSMDGGARWTLNNVTGKPLRVWDARGFIFRFRYDGLQRITHHFVGRDGFGEILLERYVYGEKHPDTGRNLKGRLYRHYDGAGVATNERYDFKGNLLESTRQLALHQPASAAAAFYNTTPDWSAIIDITDLPSLALAALDTVTAPLLISADRFTATSRFDAMNRPIQLVTPHRAGTPSNQPSVIQPSYNEARLLERIDVWIRQLAAPTTLLNPDTASVHAVTNINYNARGQRGSVTLGSGVATNYTYDPETFRLTTLTTIRPNSFGADERTVQDLAYQYDPVGNITSLRDAADIHNVIYFRNQRVEPSTDYTYDPIYRLKIATGREHLGRIGVSVQVTHDDSPRTHSAPDIHLLNRGDGNAMGNYTERYSHDSVGNLTEMIHQAGGGGWTRRYAYAEPSQVSSAETSNRLSATSLPGDSAFGPYSSRYEYDQHGNVIRMPHLPGMTWDAQDRLQSTTRQRAAAVMPETTYYAYDYTGERLRKATFWSASLGQTPNIKSERLYLGNLEIYREYDAAGVLVKERETLHVMDDKQRVAIVETLTFGSDTAPPQLIRYQFSNHLRSAILELDDHGDVISYEEYFPYGSTSYQAMRSQLETPKRYRYTAKERDEENDLYYHGARYYSPWLGRWMSFDPKWRVEETNGYGYVSNPIRLTDPTGNNGEPSLWDRARNAVRQSDTAQFALGVVYGTTQAFAPLGFLAPTPAPNSRAFEFGRGAGETATGIVQIVSGAGMIGGGGTAAAGGVAATPVSGGASLLVTAGGASVVVAGVAAIAQGGSNVVAGVGTLVHAMSMSGEGGGSSTPPGPGAAPPAAAPPAAAPEAPPARPEAPSPARPAAQPEAPTPARPAAQPEGTTRTGEAPASPTRTEHGEVRAAQARAGDPHRQVGDAGRVIREGRQFTDTQAGTTIHVSGNRVVVTAPDGRIVSQFTNTRANTQMRIRTGRWVPK